MSERFLKLGQKVEVTGKGVQGVVAYVGSTLFSSGKWIGIVLDEPKGKNNGTVQGKQYFECKDNYGTFVRQSQLTLLDEVGMAMSATSPLSSSSTGTTPDSTGRNRPRLSRSRLSLASNRSQGAYAASEEGVTSTPSASEPTSKRSSFIESGFVEMLKPEFIPGQTMVSLGSGTTIEERLAQLQELENLRGEVQDLNEKLETLTAKRLQDKERLKELDKVRMQLEQMVEFKTRIMESQASLQRELQRARQEARAAVEAREQHAEEMADLAESMEMATLDKEMAEEKAETLQLELDQAREKIEEMSVDLEILKAEMSERGGGSSDAVSSSPYEIKQLEQQNIRLRDTLVRMRDLSAHEKHEFQKLQKDFDHKKSEVAELGRTKEKLSARVEEMEHQIADLQEQVDAALGAEEMVHQLVDTKLAMEEKMKELEETVAELEQLQDMNEQVQEGTRELEVDLREELDLAQAATRKAQRELEAAIETLADRESIITKFRELVQRQQEHVQELQTQLERESSRPVAALPEMLDFKKMFAETKAHTKAIDLELRRIDVQQSNQHVQYLALYMPDMFMNRGGDHDAILMLLLVPRLIWKTEILLSQVRDKFPCVEKIDRSAVVRGHAVEQFAFKSRLSFYIYSLQMILHQFLHALNSCSPETLLKVGAAYPEMAVQEKAVDTFVELLRKDQLDENVPMEDLERCLSYFSTMFPVLLAGEVHCHQSQVLSCTSQALASACDSVVTDATVLGTLLQDRKNPGEVDMLSKYLVTSAETLQQQLKHIRRRLPQEGAVNLGCFGENLHSTMQQCCQHSAKIIRTLQDIIKASLQQIAMEGDPDVGITQEKMREFAHSASDRIYEHEDLGPMESLKGSMGFIAGEMSKILQTIQENELDIIRVDNLQEERPTAPIIIRANAVKKELEETKNLKHKLEMKESDIKELKVTHKLKQEELSEMSIRKELAEKKLCNVNKDYELTTQKLQRKLDDAQQLLKSREKEFEDTLDHLQGDIEALEAERGDLKEKIKNYTKKTLYEGLSKVAAAATTPQTSPTTSVLTHTHDSPLLMQQVKTLRLALRKLQHEKWQLQTALCKDRLANVRKLRVPNRNAMVSQNVYNPKEPDEKERKEQSNLNQLSRRASSLLQEVHHALAHPTVVDISKRMPGTKAWLDKTAPANHLLHETMKMETIKDKVSDLQRDIALEVVKRKAGGRVDAHFATFPSREMTKAYGKSEPEQISELKIPVGDNISRPAVVPLLVTAETLRLLHKQLML